VIESKDRSFMSGLSRATAAGAFVYFLKFLPWMWGPVVCIFYLLGTSMWAQTKLIWANRMKPHVSPKSKPVGPSTPKPSSSSNKGTSSLMTSNSSSHLPSVSDSVSVVLNQKNPSSTASPRANANI
jgi:cytoskeletal protein RodZ